MSGDILENMFENLVIYVWQNPLNDNDCGAILIAVEDFSHVQSLSENIHDPGKPDAKSFDELCDILSNDGIAYDDISDNMHYYFYTE
jgi:hypothetical protein